MDASKNRMIDTLLLDLAALIACSDIVTRHHELYVPFHKKLLDFVDKYDLKQDRGWIFLERNSMILYLDNQYLNNNECRSIIQFLIGQKDNGQDRLSYFSHNSLHPNLKPCEESFDKREYNNVIFEAAKIYENAVQSKSDLDKIGSDLMMKVWNENNPVLKLNECISETEKNIQEGMKYLAAGFMKHIRNPNAHLPSHEHPLSEDTCLELLGFVSYLFRQLDISVCEEKKKHN